MEILEKRDFREETTFTAAEWQQVKNSAGKLGLNTAAYIRMACLLLGDKITRDTGITTGF